MKKLFTMMSVAALAAMAMGQSVTTYSVYDVNQNGEINVADAVSVAQASLQSVEPGETQQYVTAEDLSVLLQGIQADLALIKEKLGIAGGTAGGSEAAPTPDKNGIIANGHEYVDLGLKDADGKPIYWATCNIGADKPEDYGLYFAWGETVGYGYAIDEGSYDAEHHRYTTTDGRSFDWASYSLCGGSSTTMKKYCFESRYGTVDNKDVLDLEDDAAHVNWQGSWRMPTRAEQDELRDKCIWTWTTKNGVNGYEVKGPNGNSIFLPAAGGRGGGGLGNAGSCGNYWSSWLLPPKGSNYASCLEFTSDYHDDWNYNGRCAGHSVRPVCQ